MKIKSLSVAFAIVLVVLFFVGSYYLQKKVLPAQIHKVQVNLNVPVRYAFITDKNQKKLAVLDTYANVIIDTLPIKTTADLIAVSRLGGYLVYANRGRRVIYLMNLETYETETISTDNGIEQLTVDSSGRWIMYVTQSNVYLISKKLKQAVKKVAVSGEVGLTLNPNGESLIIAELVDGHLRQLNFSSNQLKELLRLGQAISPVSILPDGRALFFNSNKQIFRYDLVSGEMKRANVSALGYRPYLTGDNRQLFVIGEKEKKPILSLLNPNDLTIVKQYPLPDVQPITENISVLASGWLDQVAVVAGKEKVHLVDLSSGKINSIELPGKITEMVVQSDSKVLLLDTQNMANKPNFITVDLQQRKIKTASVLGDISPDNIVMGQTNTLCH